MARPKSTKVRVDRDHGFSFHLIQQALRKIKVEVNFQGHARVQHIYQVSSLRNKFSCYWPKICITMHEGTLECKGVYSPNC